MSNNRFTEDRRGWGLYLETLQAIAAAGFVP